VNTQLLDLLRADISVQQYQAVQKIFAQVAHPLLNQVALQGLIEAQIQAVNLLNLLQSLQKALAQEVVDQFPDHQEAIAGLQALLHEQVVLQTTVLVEVPEASVAAKDNYYRFSLIQY